MSPKTFSLALTISVGLACSFYETSQMAIQRWDINLVLMLVAYGAVFFLLWQLVRLIQAMSNLKKSFDEPFAQPVDQPHRGWALENEASKAWSSVAALFFGRRAYAWEELLLIYAFLGAVIWSFQFLLATVH